VNRKINAAMLMLPSLLGGCFATSVRGMREREPVLVTDSVRDAATISTCIAEKWVALGLTPRTIPRTNGRTIIAERVVTYAVPLLVVDMDSSATGSHVTMRLFKTMWSKQNRKRVDEVRTCL
jgi:hypothetical protein